MEKEKIFRAIQALRAICTHTNSDGSSAYKFDGNDSHNDYFKCEICGKEK